jgi:hypothetical protein
LRGEGLLVSETPGELKKERRLSKFVGRLINEATDVATTTGIGGIPRIPLDLPCLASTLVARRFRLATAAKHEQHGVDRSGYHLPEGGHPSAVTTRRSRPPRRHCRIFCFFVCV